MKSVVPFQSLGTFISNLTAQLFNGSLTFAAGSHVTGSRMMIRLLFHAAQSQGFKTSFCSRAYLPLLPGKSVGLSLTTAPPPPHPTGLIASKFANTPVVTSLTL